MTTAKEPVYAEFLHRVELFAEIYDVKIAAR